MPMYDPFPKSSFIDLVYEQKNILQNEKDVLQLRLDLKDHVVRQAILLLENGYDKQAAIKLLKTTLEGK